MRAARSASDSRRIPQYPLDLFRNLNSTSTGTGSRPGGTSAVLYLALAHQRRNLASSRASIRTCGAGAQLYPQPSSTSSTGRTTSGHCSKLLQTTRLLESLSLLDWSRWLCWELRSGNPQCQPHRVQRRLRAFFTEHLDTIEKGAARCPCPTPSDHLHRKRIIITTLQDDPLTPLPVPAHNSPAPKARATMAQ